MVDGASLLMSAFYSMKTMGMWSGGRGGNMLDGGAPFYRTYETRDGGHMAVGAIEPPFWQELLDKLGLAGEELPHQMDVARWPQLEARLADVFATRTRDEWASLLEGTDACTAPVLEMSEVPGHEHMKARDAWVRVGDMEQPAPAPRFSRTPSGVPSPAPTHGSSTRSGLLDWGVTEDRIQELQGAGVVGGPTGEG